MAEIHDMATSLGQALGRTPEYRTLDSAIQSADDDRDIVELRNEIQRLERTFHDALAAGNEPAEEQVKEYEEALAKLQRSSVYQSLVAAQANFEKVMGKVNTAIVEGMKDGATSRIIISS